MRLVLACLLVFWSVTSRAQDQSDAGAWSATVERISSGVVSIRVDGTRAFDTEWNQSTQATGFVVDAEAGLILTNRHVVMPGPVVAEAVFLNHEEVDLMPVYRDPVHDFGLFRYDPSKLRFIKPHEFELDPSGAQIGRDIRVVGNDAGEQLSILAGTIAKLDRTAPSYGKNKYNDFNTFYLQAASSTSGGSSGSPVVDISGRVVALNAGANSNAASSFFLPLDRVQRALERVRTGQPVDRGSLQTVFRHRPYDELRRLGLDADTEARVRAAQPQQIGMLVVAQVVPDGPAQDVLEPGDILVSVGGELVTGFVPLAQILDANVDQPLNLVIERGGHSINTQVTVGDLHAITPDNFIEVGASIVHRLSYQQARHFNTAVAGVFVASPGYMLSTSAIPRGAVITQFNGTPMNDLDDFEQALEGLADGDRVPVRFFTYDDPNRTSLRVVRIDRRWFSARRCHRDDSAGYWPCRTLADGPSPSVPVDGSTQFVLNGDPRVRKISPSLVMVNFDMPYTVSGVSDRHYYGTGLVVDAENGYVVVDRNTVPVAIGDVRLTFAGSLEIPARVEYVHPLHNMAMLAYDPALIGDTPVKSAQFSKEIPAPGARVWVTGLRPDHKVVSQATEVSSVDAAEFPLTRSFRFRDSNIETIAVVNAPENVDGVLIDKSGKVISLWSSFAYENGREVTQSNKGVPADPVTELLGLVRDQQALHSLEVELWPVPLSAGRKLGLSDEAVRRLEKHDPKRRQVLSVMRLVAGSPAASLLETGDLLLAVDGQPVNNFRQVETSVQKPQVELTLWREGVEKRLQVPTVQLGGGGIDRVVVWAGALLQAPHRELAAQRGIEQKGVYVAYFGYGSPATRYGLWAGRRVIEVDGKTVADLDDFLLAVKGKGDRDSVRLKTVMWNGASDVITLKLDLKYWPAYELRHDGEQWARIDIDPPGGMLARQ